MRLKLHNLFCFILGLEHYKSYLESELKNFFQEHWHCSRCSQNLASVKQALTHLAVNHKLAQEYFDEVGCVLSVTFRKKYLSNFNVDFILSLSKNRVPMASFQNELT